MTGAFALACLAPKNRFRYIGAAVPIEWSSSHSLMPPAPKGASRQGKPESLTVGDLASSRDSLSCCRSRVGPQGTGPSAGVAELEDRRRRTSVHDVRRAIGKFRMTDDMGGDDKVMYVPAEDPRHLANAAMTRSRQKWRGSSHSAGGR
jgi:hypothetical protein